MACNIDIKDSFFMLVGLRGVTQERIGLIKPFIPSILLHSLDMELSTGNDVENIVRFIFACNNAVNVNITMLLCFIYCLV